MEALFATRSIEEKLVDESKEHYEASVETELAAKETITANKANVVASQAKIEQAKADVEAAKAEVEVAQAELEKSQVQVAFATITAPRRDHPAASSKGITSARPTSSNMPLLTIDKTDLMRVIVQVPDRDVPFTDPGDPAYVQIDALPGRKLLGHVSRIASYRIPKPV